jgi:hypothetical protein
MAGGRIKRLADELDLRAAEMEAGLSRLYFVVPPLRKH